MRSLHETWLFEATQGALPAWKRALLARALRRDARLRALALELLEFECEPAPDGPDLLPRLRPRLAAEAARPERPLFPSAWIPAGAIAALLLTALVAVGVHPNRGRQGDASVNPAAGGAAPALPALASVPLPAAAAVPSAAKSAAAPSPVSAGAATRPSPKTGQP